MTERDDSASSSGGASSSRPSVTCQLCEEKLPESSIWGHIAVEHFQFVRYRCATCELQFAYSDEIMQHSLREGHDLVPVDMAEIFPFKSQLIELITLHSRKLSSQPNEEERNKCQQDILALLKATTDELNQKKGQIDKKDSTVAVKPEAIPRRPSHEKLKKEDLTDSSPSSLDATSKVTGCIRRSQDQSQIKAIVTTNSRKSGKQKRTKSPELYCCTICQSQNRKFRRDEYMSRSMRERHVWGNHVEAKRHGCNLCNFKSRKIGSVVEHAKKNHRGVRVTIENLIPLLKPQFEATYARCFPNEIQLQVKKEPEWQRESKEPAEGTTSESPTNKCRICNELLQPATDFVIRNHVWSHASSLPYGCLACGRRMKTLKGLRSHQRSAHKRLAATAKRQYPSKALWAEHRSLMTKCFGSDVGISVESENSKDEDSQSDRESKFESVNMSDSNEETNIDTLSDKIIKKKRRYSRRSKNFPLISYMTRSTAKPIASNGRVLEHPENFLTSTCLPPSSLTDTSSNQSETELHTAVMSRKRKSSSVRRGSYKKAKHPSLNMNNDEPNSDEVHDGEFNAKKEVENPSKRKLRQRQPKVSVESEIRMIIDTENNLTKPRLAKGKIPKFGQDEDQDVGTTDSLNLASQHSSNHNSAPNSPKKHAVQVIPEQNIPSPPILSPIKPLKGASDSAAELNDSSAEPDDLIAFAHVAPLSFSPAGSNKDEEDSDIEMIEDNIPKNLTMVPTLGIRLFDVKTEETDEMMSVGEMNSDRGVSEVTSINSLSSLSKEHDTEEAEVTKPTKAKGIEPMTIGLPKILTTYSIQPEHVCYGCNKPTELGSNRCHKCTKCQLSVADINMEAHIYRHLYQSGYLAFECPFCIWNGWCYEDAKSHLCRNKSAAGAKGIDCLIDSRGSETMVKMFKLMRSICFPEISTQLNVVEIQKIKEEAPDSFFSSIERRIHEGLHGISGSLLPTSSFASCYSSDTPEMTAADDEDGLQIVFETFKK